MAIIGVHSHSFAVIYKSDSLSASAGRTEKIWTRIREDGFPSPIAVKNRLFAGMTEKARRLAARVRGNDKD